MNPHPQYGRGREIARGGMGLVLETQDLKLDRRVAMKVMLRPDASPEQQHRFEQEARVLGRLAHPNIVPIHDYGVNEEGRHYYTMKLVQGVTLQEVIDRLKAGNREALAKYSLNTLLTIFLKVCDAVAFAHSQGVIHRDLKPENIMVGEFGEVLVMDWGLAKVLHEAEPAEEDAKVPTRPDPAGLVGPEGTMVLHPTVAPATDATTRWKEHVSPEGRLPPGFEPLATVQSLLTLDGTVMGTPHYMSPEQAQGRINELDARSDIYCLGAILYVLLTLQRPVEDGSLAEIITKVINGDIPAPSSFNPIRHRPRTGMDHEQFHATGGRFPHLPGRWVPEALSAVVMKAMAVLREGRYQTVGALAADIEAHQGGFATSAENAGAVRHLRLFIQRHRTLAAAAALVVFLSMGFLAKVISSERKATRSASAAIANERVAKTNELKAVAAEKEALAEKELTRRALARAQAALAEGALRDLDGAAARAALRAVPEDLRDANWGYLLARSDTSLATLRSANSGSIRGLTPHPLRAGIFAIAGLDDIISLVDARTGTRLLEFPSGFTNVPGHLDAGTYRLSFSVDGEELAVGNLSVGKIAFHSTRDGRKLREWATPPPYAIEFSPEGRQLLVTLKGHEHQPIAVRLHDAQTGEVKWTFAPSFPWVRAAFHPTGQSVVVASGASSVRLLDAHDGREIRALPDSGPFVNSLAVSPDGELAAYGDEQGGVRCVRLKDGQLAFDFRAAVCTIRQLHFTADNRRLVTLAFPANSSYHHVRVWDSRHGHPLHAVLGADNASLLSSIHPVSGELVIVSGQTKSWDLNQSEPQWKLVSGVNDPWVSFLGDDDVLCFRGSFGEFRVERLAANGTQSVLWQSQSDAKVPFPVASVSANGRVVLAGNREDLADFFLLQHDGTSVKEIARWKPAATPPFLRLNPAGDRVWTGGHLLDVATGKAQQALSVIIHGRLIDCDWVSSNRLVVASFDGAHTRISLAAASSGEVLCTATNSSRGHALAVGPGGQLIAEAGDDKLVRLRDPVTLALKREFRAHDGSITALAFHPRAPVLATTSDDLTMRLWNYETGALLEEMRGLQVTPSSLAWSPGGKRLATAGIDRLARVWEPRSLNARVTGTPGDWESLLASLKPDEVATNGQGWVFENGNLRSPDRMFGTVPLPGDWANTSYHLELKFRRPVFDEALNVFLPVAGRHIGFLLDGYPKSGCVSGLYLVDGEHVPKHNAVRGRQVNDSDAHQLDILVRVGPRTAIIDVKLDERPFFQWIGQPNRLSISDLWSGLAPGQLGLGAHKAGWVILGAKVRRLDGK